MAYVTEDSSKNQIALQIEPWVKEQVLNSNRERGPCKKLVLRHLNHSKKPQGDVISVAVNQDPGLSADTDHLVKRIVDSAQDDANSMSAGLQNYAVYAYFAKDPNYSPRKFFRVAANEDIEQGVEPSEPPTEKGLTTQLMRHVEIIMKNSMVTMGYQFATMQKENERLRTQNERFAEQHFNLMALFQEMMDNVHKRRLDEKQAELQMSMLEGVFEHLKVALPVIVNRLAGKDVIPQSMNRGFYLLSALLEGLSPEQQNMLQSNLSQPQLSLFAELIQVYEEEKHKIGGNGGEKGKEQLLKMFEKRGDLVKADKAVVLAEGRTKEIEDRATELMNGVWGKPKDKDKEKTPDQVAPPEDSTEKK